MDATTQSILDRIARLENSQRTIIGDKERLENAMRYLQKLVTEKLSEPGPKPAGGLSSFTPAHSDEPSASDSVPALSRPVPTWTGHAGKAGKLEAVITGLDKLNKETSWLFQIGQKPSAAFTIVIEGKFLRTDSQNGIDDLQIPFKHKVGAQRQIHFGPGDHTFVWVWNEDNITLTVTDRTGREALRQHTTLIAPVSGRIAVGQQARPGRYANVGPNVMVKAVQLSV